MTKTAKDIQAGSIVLIAYVLIIIVNSIKLYKLCKEDEKDMYEGLKDLSLAQKVILRRQINKVCPELSRKERGDLFKKLIEKAENIPFEEFIQLLLDIDKVIVYTDKNGKYHYKEIT